MVQQSSQLLGLQIANFTINMAFLVLFIYRFLVLRSFARTERFEDYFPKLRIFFSLVYVLVNIGLLVEMMELNQIQQTALEIVLVVLGEGIVSIILFIQLLVLRLELLKEQPYTRFHIAYFLYLCLFSIARLIIYFFYQDNSTVIDKTLSSVLILDSIVQFTYWMVKKQSLPQFQVHTNAEIDFKHHSRLIENILETDRSFRNPSEDAFPYIVPFVSVDNGRIKIILEIASPSQVLVQGNQAMAPKTYLQPTSKGSEALGRNRETRSQDASNREQTRQILSSSYYSVEEIKNLYVICGRFPMKKSLSFHFSPLSLPEMAKDLQTFLNELFHDRRWYQPSVLKYLRIPLDRLKEYSDILEKYSAFNKDTDLDQTIGLKVVQDKNATFFSVSVYKHLWIDDHYQFYIKVISRQTKTSYYPIKRFSEFEDFNNELRYIIKSQNKDLILPLIPKKHLFHWNQGQQINQRRAQLERYLRLLSNDYAILSLPALKKLLFQFLGVQDEVGAEGLFAQQFYRETTVTKGEVSKCLVSNDLVTYYEFKVFQQGIDICTLSKRFSQFEELHREVQRWMRNIQITYKAVVLPERLYYKSEATRHERLKNYLQAVMEMRDVGRVYAVNSFFNIAGNEGGDISEIEYSSRMDSKNVMNQVIELAQNIRPNRQSESQESSRRFSQVLNNLGDPAFD